MTRALTVWQWTDGKRGHERQCEGLVAALAERVCVNHRLLRAPSSAWARGLAFCGGPLPLPEGQPDLLLGAGRACQLPLLAARRRRGGRAVYLMRPQLPLSWFDLNVVPRHDGVAASAHVVVSEGPLNPVRPAAARDESLGLVLLGGASAHHAWDSDAMLAQLERVLRATPARRWVVTDSRRAPADLAVRLAALPGIEFHSHRETPPDWLPALLARAAEVWVSADSVSMIYEALSGGARVGVLDVPPRRADRITTIAADLRARGLTHGVDEAPLTAAPPTPLDEAGRVAELILARWFTVS
ncbi:MAG: mitochondrial fission ELM1 family protein [Gammaproteobacteria bacterium]